MKRGIICFVFVLNYMLSAQSHDKTFLDSIFNKYASGFKGVNNISERKAEFNTKPEKCGTILSLQIRDNIKYFTNEQQAILKKLSERPECDTSIVTPQKHFRVHYDTVGYNSPKYDINELAKALDSSYNFEVNYLHYPPPPADHGKGGDDLYDVYLLSSNDYGSTQPEENISAEKDICTSYIIINNNFGSNYSQGIDAARVTAAHELHHAIQFGNYGSREELYFFMEVTATSMEEFVFDSINDYYNYLRTYFTKSWHRFNKFQRGTNFGYELAIWNIFQKEKFGYDIIKKEWELVTKYSTLDAFNRALQEYNSSFIEAYNEFGEWCWFTNYRAVKGKYFPEAVFYPPLDPLNKTELYPLNSFSFDLKAYPASNNTILITNKLYLDTLVLIITNGDIETAKKDIDTIFFGCSFDLKDSYSSGFKKISNRYNTRLTGNSSGWLSGVILNGAIIETGIAELPWVENPFPVPFSYKNNNMLYFPITNPDIGTADLYIYNSSMTLIFNGSQTINRYLDKKVVKWGCKDNSGQKLGSGIYFYTIKTENNTIKGKVAIIND